MTPRALAIAAHPDDIELVMAGTLLRLRDAGYEIHYLTVANGSCGSVRTDAAETARLRREEARAAAASAGAVFHEALVPDLEIFYERALLARLGAIVREVAPEIILTHGPCEYMEDHSNTCRLVVSAAFCRGMPNFPVTPPTPPTDQPVTVYHALPFGLRDPLRRAARAGLYVDVGPVLARKREMLACHRSQKEWLDISQGMDSYLTTMEEMTRAVGRLSGRFACAEGWTRHLHLGFCDTAADPLLTALAPGACVDAAFERDLG